MKTSSIDNEVKELATAWKLIFPTVPGPDSRQFAVWILTHGAGVVRHAIATLAGRYSRSSDGFDEPECLHKFAAAIMNRLSREAR